MQAGLCYLQKIPADPTRNGICKIPFLFSNRSCLNEGFVFSDTTFSEVDLPSSGLQTKSLTRPVLQGTWSVCRMIYPKFSFFQVERGAGWIMLPAENTSWPNHTVFAHILCSEQFRWEKGLCKTYYAQKPSQIQGRPVWITTPAEKSNCPIRIPPLSTL